jgi:hypothetical protein
VPERCHKSTYSSIDSRPVLEGVVADRAVAGDQEVAMPAAAQQQEALAAEERFAAAPGRVDVDRGIGRQPGPGLYQERPP